MPARKPEAEPRTGKRCSTAFAGVWAARWFIALTRKDRPRAARRSTHQLRRFDHECSGFFGELTGADLKDNLHDVQDNVVEPILTRYGRHIFVKFHDAEKARAWLRAVYKRVNLRCEEHQAKRFTVNIGFTYEGLKVLRLSQRSLDSFPEAFRVGMAAAHLWSATSGPMRQSIGRAVSAVLTSTR